MKKKTIKAVAIGLVAVIFAGILLNGYTFAYMVNWGIYIPVTSFYRQAYEVDSGASFNGDGIRYHTYKYLFDYPIEAMFEWSDTEQETIYYQSIKETSNAWLKEINADKNYYPHYSHCVYWYHTDGHNEMIIFLNTEENTFYIIEHIM